MYGWAGQRLKVYLSEGKVVKEELPQRLREEYLGGRGLNARTLYDDVKPGVDPLGPDNVFMVAAGPIVGTLVPGSCRYTVTAKSPLTGVFGDANGGGDFAAELKFAGFDQAVFYGKSPVPVYLWVKDGKAQLRDASHLWGKDVWETHHTLVKELDEPGLSEISIGPAGENKVRFACVLSNLSRAAGRAGIGAVMGLKNLKAVAVRGTGAVKIARPDDFYGVVNQAKHKITAHPFYPSYRQTGSMMLTATTNMAGTLGTKNQQKTWFEGVDKLDSKAFEAQFAVRHRGCFACPTHCSHYYEVKDGPYRTHGEGVDFGAVGNLGARCGNSNLASVLYGATLCNQLGLDNISCGAVIGFAMEAWQRGLISAKDTDGLELNWGNADSIIALVRKIAYREGFGDLLAEGVERASYQIQGSGSFAMTIKGMETLQNDPRGEKGNALAFATGTRGGDHLRGLVHYLLGYVPGGKEDELERRFGDRLGRENARSLANMRQYQGWAGLLAICQDQFAAANSMEICNRMCFANFGLDIEDLAKLLSATTGMEMNGRELEIIGERVFNVEKAFNIREGLRRDGDTLPQRWFLEKVPDGPAAGEHIELDKFQKMLDEYYEFRGWDSDGVPTEKKLEELDLTDITAELRGRQ